MTLPGQWWERQSRAVFMPPGVCPDTPDYRGWRQVSAPAARRLLDNRPTAADIELVAAGLRVAGSVAQLVDDHYVVARHQGPGRRSRLTIAVDAAYQLHNNENKTSQDR